jgi:hypothetical protein
MRNHTSVLSKYGMFFHGIVVMAVFFYSMPERLFLFACKTGNIDVFAINRQ